MRPLIEVTKLRKTYGRQVVLDDVSFLVAEGQKVGLLGRNGAGKSTLLKILMGDEEANGGEVRFFPWTRLGVVKQHEPFPEGLSAEGFLEKVSGKPVWEVARQASRFGVTPEMLKKMPQELSGGYQMRLKLIALFLAEPNLLLLDEPVNYLDLQTLILLERVLRSYKGGMILVAHDRTFLQKTCTSTYSLEKGSLKTYAGAVEEYLVYRAEQQEFLRRTNKKLAREISDNQAFVDRFRAKASQATRAQSKMKHIDKLRTKLSTLDSAETNAHIVLPSVQAPKGTAVRLEDLSIGYENKVLADHITFEIQRGEKVLIAGENSRGKSTLLKTLAGKITSLHGTVKWWHRASIGYFDQHTDRTLVPSETVLQYLTRMAPPEASGEKILMMAGNMLFKNDDLEKTANVLSGGERSRLCLAGVLLRKHNVLLLDEPTNHLDVETTDILSKALNDYDGTVILVSHARSFVEGIVDRVYEVRGGSVKMCMGSYSDYVHILEDQMAEESRASLDEKQSNSGDNRSREERAENKQMIREQKKVIENIEKQMKKLDREKSEILAFFFENPLDYDVEKTRELQQLTEELTLAEENWIKAEERLEKLKAK